MPAQLKYTADGYPFYEADPTDTVDNVLYNQPTQQITVNPIQQQQPLPIDTALAGNPFTAGIQAFKNLTTDKNGERYQTWPERLVRSATTLPVDVMQGNVLSGPGLRREDYTDMPVATEPTKDSTWLGQKLGLAPISAQPLDPMMERAQDMAGLAGGSTLAIKPGTASVGSGMIRMIKNAKENINDVMDSNFTYPELIGDKIVPIESLKGGVSTDPKEIARVDRLANKINSPDGYIERLIVDTEGNVLEGQHRLDALRKNGITEVPVTVIKDLEVGYDIPAMKEAIKNSGVKNSDQINGIMKHTLQILHETNGNISEAMQYEIPGFNNQFEAALKASDKPKLIPVDHDPFAGGKLLSDTSTPGAPLAALENAPAFYSAVENAVKNAKQNVATADQWLGYLKNQPGVKQEELDWTLGSLPKGKITKAELEQHVADHKVELKEVNKGDIEWHELRYKDTLARRLEGFKDLPIHDETDVMSARQHNPNFNATIQGKSSSQVLQALEEARNFPKIDEQKLFRHYDTKDEALKAIKEAGAEGLIEEPLKRRDSIETKYHGYQLPGGENYREMLLTLPDKKITATPEEIETLAKKRYEAYHRTENLPAWEGLNSDVQRMYREEAEYKTYLSDNANAFRSSHWDEPNVLAHIRMNDRVVDGKKTLHIEEIQSDAHQLGRKQGYKGDYEARPVNEGHGWKLFNKRTNEFEGVTYNEETAKQLAKDKGAVPNMPFKKNWDELALKKIIRHAAEENEKNEIANWNKLVQNEPDRLAHMFVKDGTLKEICD